MKIHRVLNKYALSKKPGGYMILSVIYNQNLKNSGHCFWDIYQEELTKKFIKVSWWALWV